MAPHQARAVIRRIGNGKVGLRFENIPRPLFIRLLKRMRFDFPLAQYGQVDEAVWWIFAQSQFNDVLDFARRNGLEVELLDDEVAV